jgi:hypothetical protein
MGPTMGRGNMRPVMRVLLGSAAAIFTVSGAQAADLPTKAQPVEYVRAPRPCVTSIKSK